jgi:hypothetical protein
MFLIELVIPFFFFTPARLRFWAALVTLLLQLLILLTGNYGFFNLLAIALCLFLFDEATLARMLPARLAEKIRQSVAGRSGSSLGHLAVTALAGLIILLSGSQLAGLFFGRVPPPMRPVLTWLAPFHLVNTYGLFAVMTTVRPEIIIEGSQDGQTWRVYEFKYKPGAVQRPPAWVAPYQPRLDWQMWFAALGGSSRNSWFGNLMLRLQQGSPEVLALLANNPFPDAPPRYLRAWLEVFRFTDFATLRSEGAWWRRERVGLYYPLPE